MILMTFTTSLILTVPSSLTSPLLPEPENVKSNLAVAVSDVSKPSAFAQAFTVKVTSGLMTSSPKVPLLTVPEIE